MDANDNWAVAPNYNANMERKGRMPTNLMGNEMRWANGVAAEANDFALMASLMNYPMVGNRMGMAPPGVYPPNLQIQMPPIFNLANPIGISNAGTAHTQISHTPFHLHTNNVLVSPRGNTPETNIAPAVENNIPSSRQEPTTVVNVPISNGDSKVSTAEVNTIASTDMVPGAKPTGATQANITKYVTTVAAPDAQTNAAVQKKKSRSKPRKRPAKQSTDKKEASTAIRSRKRTMATLTASTVSTAPRKNHKKFNNIKVVDGVESILPALSSPLNIEAFKTHIPLRPHLWHEVGDHDDGKNDIGKELYKEVGPWEWSDDEQVEFQKVERIHVHRDVATVRERITQARITGTPIVLVGHKGWPGFSSRWLRKKEEMKGSQKRAQEKEEGMVKPLQLDLSTCDYEVDIERMSADVGNEMVPTIRKNYDESNPIDKEISISNFLKDHWSTMPITEGKMHASSAEATAASTTEPSHQSEPVEQPNPSVIDSKEESKGLLYLHQWQFPNSKTAVAKLCRRNNYDSNTESDGIRRPRRDGCEPLPHDILGEDLLSHWLDMKINPYQYIFMGGTETNSKLHADLGGLEIFIAPLVGEKECVLVHRDDGDKALYGVTIPHPVDHNVNLHRFPSFRFTRIWKTVVGPGEILLMPQGTYHQCRNITPCLSYSRFHLDTVNLPAFLKSMIKGDADEIVHDEVLWNCAIEFGERVDQYVKSLAIQKTRDSLEQSPPREIRDAVKTLGIFRHACCKVHQSFRAKENSWKDSPRTHLGNSQPKFLTQRTGHNDCWAKMVDDIDRVLHDFTYRHATEKPSFSPSKKIQQTVKIATGDTLKNRQVAGASFCDPPPLETAHNYGVGFSTLEDVEDSETDMVIEDSMLASLEPLDELSVRFHGKIVPGWVLKVVDPMDAVLVAYDDVSIGDGGNSDIYNHSQHHPVSQIQWATDREYTESAKKVPVVVGNIKAGDLVLCPFGGTGKTCRARVQSIMCTTFFLVRLQFNGDFWCDRWMTGDSIVAKTKEVGSALHQAQLFLCNQKGEMLESNSEEGSATL